LARTDPADAGAGRLARICNLKRNATRTRESAEDRLRAQQFGELGCHARVLRDCTGPRRIGDTADVAIAPFATSSSVVASMPARSAAPTSGVPRHASEKFAAECPPALPASAFARAYRTNAAPFGKEEMVFV
jgi:hypothetical protein